MYCIGVVHFANRHACMPFWTHSCPATGNSKPDSSYQPTCVRSVTSGLQSVRLCTASASWCWRNGWNVRQKLNLSLLPRHDHRKSHMITLVTVHDFISHCYASGGSFWDRPPGCACLFWIQSGRGLDCSTSLPRGGLDLSQQSPNRRKVVLWNSLVGGRRYVTLAKWVTEVGHWPPSTLAGGGRVRNAGLPVITGNTLLAVTCEYCRRAPSDFGCPRGSRVQPRQGSDSSRRAHDTAATMLDHSRHRGESATKTVRFFAAHTVNCVICKNLTRIDWMLLNFTPVIQQNCHQPDRNFEKSFCAVDRLSCQNPKPANSEAILFLIVNYVHVTFLHGG